MFQKIPPVFFFKDTQAFFPGSLEKIFGENFKKIVPKNFSMCSSKDSFRIFQRIPPGVFTRNFEEILLMISSWIFKLIIQEFILDNLPRTSPKIFGNSFEHSKNSPKNSSKGSSGNCWNSAFGFVIQIFFRRIFRQCFLEFYQNSYNTFLIFSEILWRFLPVFFQPWTLQAFYIPWTFFQGLLRRFSGMPLSIPRISPKKCSKGSFKNPW